MITKVGYICKTFKLTEEEQREALEKRIDKNMILLDKDRRRLVLSVLPDELEKGSIVYIASLSVLGDRVYKIQAVLEKFKEKEIAVYSILENISTLTENEWCKWIRRIGDLEIDAAYYRENVKEQKSGHRGGRKRINVTDEMREVLIDYKRGRLSLKQATQKLGCGNSALYTMLKRERGNLKVEEDKEKKRKAVEVREWLKPENKRAMQANEVFDRLQSGEEEDVIVFSW